MPPPVALALSVVLLGAACQSEKPAPTSETADASTARSRYATVDPKLVKALQTATSTTTATGGPPPGGIFAPGAADERHPVGMPTKVDLVSDGSEPRMSLVDGSPDAVRATSYGLAAFELGVQMGPRVALPTIDLGLVLGPAKKDDGGPDWLVAEVKKATAAKDQVGTLAPDTEQQIATLAGTQFRIKVPADGRASDESMRFGKSALPALGQLAHNALEALMLAIVPLPSKPVGVGAQWIAESRMPMSGLDVIAYRAYRVKSITGDRLHLSLEVKGYAASKETHLQGVPKGAELVQVDAEGQGELELVKGEVLARKSDMQQRIVMVFKAPGAAQDEPPSPDQQTDQPDQALGRRLTAQIESKGTLVRGPDLREAIKHP
ncbi:MAG: hypothetical protein ACREJ3_12695 [Polyangiaceae bacterium]